MAITDSRMSVLEIINEVEQYIGVTPSKTLVANKGVRKRLSLLNAVIAEINSAGDWEEDYFEKEFTLALNQNTITFSNSDNLKRIAEVRFEFIPSPLITVQKERMRLLRSLNQSGSPRQWCINGVDNNGNPVLTFNPKVGPQHVGKKMFVYGYKKPEIYTGNDPDLVPNYPATLVIKGLHYKVMLEIFDGAQTAPIKRLEEEYFTSMQENLNRFTNDSGSTFIFRPVL
jgi:hypothetical protein